MNRRYLIEITNYSNWVDNIIIKWLEHITDQQWDKEIASSFNSVAKTALHIVSAKKVWIDFWKNTPNPCYLSSEFAGTKNELIEIWKKTMDDYKEFIENYPVENYPKTISFKVREEEWHMEFAQTVLHQNNHADYHRGQLVTMLRQAGFTGFSNTDFATYVSIKT
ncbi:DinB family protein [Flavobacterium sp. NPDC079362]|uniref:DinB family protein n=1 Tax=Flavobacterium sp. NPDC079362 TaxID=3390566 RepID=UPI003CFC546D